MHVEILDSDVFFGVNPSGMENYLTTNDWQELRRLPNNVSIWSKRDDHGQILRLWLPLDFQLSDYADMMRRAVRLLSDQEERSQLEILEDLNTVSVGDVIRVNSSDEFNRNSNSLPFADGLSLIHQVGDMTTAAAMSEHQAREVHPNRRPQVVGDFVSRMRLGQTEHGSYIVKLISPIDLSQTKPPANEPELPNIPVTPPFSRRAIIRLLDGVIALRDVSEEQYRRGKFHIQPYVEAVSHGVSANLCESITNQKNTEKYQPLNISVTWSYLLAPEKYIRRVEVELPTHYMGYIAQAANEFRKRNPEIVNLSGYVKVLSREQGETSGSISLVAVYERRPRSIRMELSGEEYQAAIHAHGEDLTAYVTGTLVQHGQRYYLEEVTEFQIQEPML